MLLPDRRRTFDRNRLPTPVEHLVAEYEADVTTVSDAHVEDFLRGVGEWRDDSSVDARAEEIDRHRQRSIHVHCWSQDEFPDTLLHVIETAHQPWELVDAVFVEDVADSIEFGYVLRKPGSDRDAALVGTRFREVLDRLRERSAREATERRAAESSSAVCGQPTPSTPTARVTAILRDSRLGPPLGRIRRRGQAMVARVRQRAV